MNPIRSGSGAPCLDPNLRTWGQALRAGALLLCASSTTPELDAAVVLSHVTGASRAQLIAYPERGLSEAECRAFRDLLERRAAGEPVAYLTGHREFMGLDFATDARALIPRPETELLVEAGLEAARARLARGITPIAADIGTGSGAIAVSLAALEPRLPRVYAVDVAADALALARENVERLGVRDRVMLLQGDLLDPLPEPVDLLLANLPYIALAEAETLPPDVREFEPAGALFGAEDGLGHFRRLFAGAAPHLRPAAAVMLEIGADQGAAVRDLARRAFPTATVEVRQDYAGLDRLVTVHLPDLNQET
jgi:release factor glutamine methyltransferase